MKFAKRKTRKCPASHAIDSRCACVGIGQTGPKQNLKRESQPNKSFWNSFTNSIEYTYSQNCTTYSTHSLTHSFIHTHTLIDWLIEFENGILIHTCLYARTHTTLSRTDGYTRLMKQTVLGKSNNNNSNNTFKIQNQNKPINWTNHLLVVESLSAGTPNWVGKLWIYRSQNVCDGANTTNSSKKNQWRRLFVCIYFSILFSVLVGGWVWNWQ